MTKIERKRARLLADTLRTCGSAFARTKVIMILLAVLAAAFDAAIFFAVSADNEIYVAMILHIAFTQMFTAAFMNGIGAQVGDSSFIADIGNRNFGGSYYHGKFIVSLPFEAKDLMNLRLINCEARIFICTVTTAAVMAVITVMGTFGYYDYRGIVGMAVLFMPLMEIIGTLLHLFCKRWYFGMIVDLFCAFPPVFTMLGCCDESGESSAELALQFNEKLKGFEFMSGISGIIILAAVSAAIAIGAETLVKNMKKRSWQLK